MYYNRLRDLIGFIPQHDTILPDFTIRRISCTLVVCYLVGSCKTTEFGKSVCDQLVGGLLGGGGRGTSGGEYKRVSIALALTAAPKALILDEPTSSLDATAAHSLMKLLHSSSRQNIMVICLIHQPRVEKSHLLDDLLVLNSGEQVYLGKAAEALGHEFSVASTPADMILDVLINHCATQNEKKISLCAFTEQKSSGIEMSEAMTALFQVVKQRRASWLRQLWLAFSRNIAQQSQQITGLALEIVFGAVIGLMIGLAAFESRGHFFQEIHHHPFHLLSSAVYYRLVVEQGLLCCLAISCAAGPPGFTTFGEEKSIFYRESQSGHSRSAYFLGKNLAVCFRMVVASLHFTAFYLISAAPIIPFNKQLGLTFLYFYCIYGLRFVVSAVIRREDGPLLCMLLGLIISALSGCARRLSTVRNWHLAWFWYSWPAPP
ncbi:hypothetical protein N7520_003439 [Penicillium odoratum]|uniref:uncharacterized protein n=1 Tax=Penicillium odoratum TaxID=1167516 RepID=UPI002547651F|nr:uncharacterized protein N7520_003439 [Penicillium odoratum]KAJ5768880.1 hypothetical protein N7520_003439 [Penicillium odoratum]